jgi:hypothetical protein
LNPFNALKFKTQIFSEKVNLKFSKNSSQQKESEGRIDITRTFEVENEQTEVHKSLRTDIHKSLPKTRQTFRNLFPKSEQTFTNLFPKSEQKFTNLFPKLGQTFRKLFPKPNFFQAVL